MMQDFTPMVSKDVRSVRKHFVQEVSSFFENGKSVRTSWVGKKGRSNSTFNLDIFFSAVCSNLNKLDIPFSKHAENVIEAQLNKFNASLKIATGPINSILSLVLEAPKDFGIVIKLCEYRPTTNNLLERDGVLCVHPHSIISTAMSVSPEALRHFNSFDIKSVPEYLPTTVINKLIKQDITAKDDGEEIEEYQPIPSTVSHEVDLRQYFQQKPIKYAAQ